jgi:hypothetical protein
MIGFLIGFLPTRIVDAGVYLLVQEIDETFLEERYGYSGKGMLISAIFPVFLFDTQMLVKVDCGKGTWIAPWNGKGTIPSIICTTARNPADQG